MTPHRLRVFLEVARTGSVRRAAEHLVVTMPAVTAAVRALEEDLGVRLTARQGRGIVLTAAGKVLAHYAAQVLGVLDEARGAVQEASRPERGRIRLAAVMTVGEYVVPGVIRQFAARHPEVEFVLEVGNRRLVWDRLREHEADLAMSGRPSPGERFDAEPFLRLERVVVASPTMPVPSRLRAEDLASLTWLVREPGAGSTAAAEDFLARTGVAPRTLRLGSNAAIIESVALGLGVSLMPLDAVRRELDGGRLTTLPVPGIPKPDSWYVLRRAGEEPAGAAGLFLEFVRRLGAAIGDPSQIATSD